MSMRVQPAAPPFDVIVQQHLDRIMPAGKDPLVLFTTLARDTRLFTRFMGGGLLDRGHLTMRQREIVIDRVTARCGSEYEWGVHIAAFAKAARLTAREIASFVQADVAPDIWPSEDVLLIGLADGLLASADIDDVTWSKLRDRFSEEAIIELILLVGFYRTVSCLTNGLRLPLEPDGAHFADFPSA